MNTQQIVIQELRGMLENLESQERDITAKKDQIKGVIKQIEDAVTSTSVQANNKTALFPIPSDESGDKETVPFPYHKIKGLSQPRATIVIAKHNNGYLRPMGLAHILLQAGLMKPTKNSASIASRLIRDSERFERISAGLYRLKTFEASTQKTIPETETAQIVQ